MNNLGLESLERRIRRVEKDTVFDQITRFPAKNSGTNGEIKMGVVNGSPYIFGKFGNQWYQSPMRPINRLQGIAGGYDYDSGWISYNHPTAGTGEDKYFIDFLHKLNTKLLRAEIFIQFLKPGGADIEANRIITSLTNSNTSDANVSNESDNGYWLELKDKNIVRLHFSDHSIILLENFDESPTEDETPIKQVEIRIFLYKILNFTSVQTDYGTGEIQIPPVTDILGSFSKPVNSDQIINVFEVGEANDSTINGPLLTVTNKDITNAFEFKALTDNTSSFMHKWDDLNYVIHTIEKDGEYKIKTSGTDSNIVFDSKTGIYKFHKDGKMNDLCSLTVTDDGATTIATVDSDGTSGDLTLQSDGDIYLNSAGANIKLDTTQINITAQAKKYIMMDEITGGGDANDLEILGSDAAAGTTDKDGGDLVLRGGQGTGTGDGGKIWFYTSTPAGSTGTTKNGSDLAGYFHDDKSLKLYGNLVLGGADDNTTLSCAATTGVLTIATDGDGVNDSDLVLDADGDIHLDAGSGGTSNGIYLMQASAKMGLISGHHSATYLRLFENIGASSADYLDIFVGAGGATTLQTVDAAGSDADLTLTVDGDITLDSQTGVFIAKQAGTEFSADNSAYAGMILGYTRLQGDGTNSVSHEIQDTMTVEDSTHQITFKTPPSEKVEIETTCLINVNSTDTEVNIGLSDNATYNKIGELFEYDTSGVIFSDDELDDHIVVSKFVLEAAQLASVGSSNTFYIGFSTGGSTKTAYLQYGLRSSHGICDHPFVIKATALPATIYDGT